ncbi:MAG: methyl-accepting chemotaxis protein [Gemmataceae bacterium]
MNWRLSNISIRTRLYAMVILTLITMALILTISLYQMHQYMVDGPRHLPIKSKRVARTELAPPTLYLSEFYMTLQEMETATNPEVIQRLQNRAEGFIKNYEKTFVDSRAKLSDPDIQRMLDNDLDRTARELIRIARTDYLSLVGKEGQQAKISSALREKISPAFGAHRKVVLDLDETLVEKVDKLDDDLQADARTAQFRLILGSIIFVALGAILGFITTRGIVDGTRVLMNQVNQLSSGAADLTARVPVTSNDEMGELATGINGMIAKFQAIVSKVRESSIQLLSTASEIASTAREQENTVQGLSSSTTEVAAAVREITATTKELSGTMNEVNNRANQAASLAASGRARLANMEATMGQLVESTSSISSKLATIREKADSINMVVTTITKVADQTNLLSINAAIEAEKAGEYGRGFLVVAREIRRLADQTAVATLDIENMVRHMQDAVSTGVMQMDKFSDEVRSGVSKVAEINGQTGQIIEEVHGLSERYHQVNQGMQNQTIGAEQINEAMASMTSNIRQTAASLEEFNRATGHLRGSVELLNQEVNQFKS